MKWDIIGNLYVIGTSNSEFFMAVDGSVQIGFVSDVKNGFRFTKKEFYYLYYSSLLEALDFRNKVFDLFEENIWIDYRSLKFIKI